MKTYYLYELINLYGTVEDVGYSSDPERRMYQHTKVKPGPTRPGTGRHYGRSDLSMVIVSEFSTRKEAAQAEIELKYQHGLPQPELINGFNVARRKLSIEQAQQIRAKYIPRKYTIKKLAKEYGVAVRVIQLILNNKTYNETYQNLVV